jgi:hypothetical protein
MGRSVSLLLSCLSCALATAWTATAHATQEFPDVVKSYYDLSMHAVDQQGCQLCHVDDMGGPPTTLRSFGRLLFNEFNVAPYDDGSLRSALMALDSQEPMLGADIKSGADPNNDPTLGMSVTNGDSGGGGSAATTTTITDPVPGYGCAIGPSGRSSKGRTVCGPLGALALVLALRRRPGALRRRRSPKAPA